MKIAAVLACYNRREKTLACLASLFTQELPEGAELSVYLLDDGSSDGTGEAVRERFAQVNLLEGDGSYFWNGGMRAAFGAAIDEGHDFYLWLNDDVELDDGFLSGLMNVHDRLTARHGPLQVVIGAVRDPDTDDMTYSGMKSTSTWHPMKFEKVAPDQGEPLECDTMNGNCVLIPSKVVDKTGNIDDGYTHAMGDMDYGFRARDDGARLWIAPGYVGTCEGNEKRAAWRDTSLPLRQRLAVLNSPHGLPLREYARLVRRRSKVLWPFFALLPYAKVVGGALGARQGVEKS